MTILTPLGGGHLVAWPKMPLCVMSVSWKERTGNYASNAQLGAHAEVREDS